MKSISDLEPGILAGTASALLLTGALGFQYLGGLPPCPMCHWQRWPHIAAILIGLGGGLLVQGGILPRVAALPIGVIAALALGLSGAIGVYHAGVEWMLWPGPATCAGLGFVPGAADDPNAFRLVRCDVAPWRFLGLSLAGYNGLISLSVAGFCLWLSAREK